MTDRAVQPRRHRYESGPLSGICRACGAKEFSEAHGVAQERPPIDVLRSALERTLANFEAVLARRPVRDATETIAEARAALAGGSVASPEPSE
jgi:hypothetical protein